MAAARLHPHWAGGRAGYVYSVIHDGCLLVSRSRDPECDAARAVLTQGITGTLTLLDGKTGKARIVIDIEKASKLTVEETGSGPRLRKYRERGGSKGYSPETASGARSQAPELRGGRMSASVNSSAAEAAKWEQVRRLRYGDFLRLFRDRYYTRGFVHFPDDEGGRDDLWLLVGNVSLAAAEPKKKMRHVIEMWAPWMPDDERDRYVEHVWGLDFYERLMTAREIGERLGLTNSERERLKLWQFKPIDMTDDELAAHRKRKNNERRKARRSRTRAEYLGSCLTTKKPWEGEGISRSQWYRRMRQLAVSHDTEDATTRGRNNSVKAESILVASLAEDRRKGIHGRGGPVGGAASDEGREAESHAACSSAVRHNLSHENPKSTVPENLRAALERLKEGVNGR